MFAGGRAYNVRKPRERGMPLVQLSAADSDLDDFIFEGVEYHVSER